MSRCKQCGIEVLDHTAACPLCKFVLEQNENRKESYPDIRFRVRKLTFAVRIYLFVAIILEVLFGYLNYKFFNGMWWSVITGAGLAYIYFILQFGILGENIGYKTKIVSITLLGILYVILIDCVVGYHGWSVNYALPGGFLFVDFAIVVLMLLNRRNWQSYMMLEIFMICLSAIPLVMVFLDIVTETFISGLAFTISVLLFLGTVILGDRRARMELHRRFHVR
ncbi:MAG: DUF6320 domain-containing protein [Roseburia sp.]|nr:DUF6320 domain-containing protein [Roseburia sp.]